MIRKKKTINLLIFITIPLGIYLCATDQMPWSTFALIILASSSLKITWK